MKTLIIVTVLVVTGLGYIINGIVGTINSINKVQAVYTQQCANASNDNN